MLHADHECFEFGVEATNKHSWSSDVYEDVYLYVLYIHTYTYSLCPCKGSLTTWLWIGEQAERLKTFLKEEYKFDHVTAAWQELKEKRKQAERLKKFLKEEEKYVRETGDSQGLAGKAILRASIKNMS